MAEPFSTNELFLRSDRIAFGKIPPEVIERTEQTLILPDVTGSKLYFGLSSLVSTSGLTGTLEAIYPNYASFTFDNLNSRLGINVSTPQYSIDISTMSGVRIQGGSLIANATGLVSVPTASLFSTLPSYVFAPGTIPVTAIVSTGGSVLPGISVPTSALFSTLPTSLFAPSSIPLVALQSSGIIVASSFVGSGFYLSNIPLANINGTITGDFFRPNSIPLSTLASTGQIWIRNPEGSIFVPYLSTAQLLTSSLTAPNISTVNLTTNRFIASSIQANYFESGTFAASNISAINIKASSIDVLCRISAGTFSGDGRNITNLTPAFLNNVIPSDKFGYRLIGINAINPYGNWQWIAGTFTLQQAAPLVSLGDIQASSFTGGVFRGDGRGLFNLNSISTASLVSTVRGLGTVGYVSSLSLTSSLVGLGSINYVSTASLVSTVIGLSHSGYVSSTQVISTIEGLGTLGYVSSTQLASTVRGLATSGYISSTQLNSTLTGLATLGFVSSTQLASTVEGMASANYISSTQLNSTLQGLSQIGYVSTTQLTSTVFSLENQNYSTSAGNTKELVSSLTGLASLGYISTSQLNSTLTGLASLGYVSTTQLTSTVFSLETQNYSTSAGNTGELVSSLRGLGSLGYISSAQLISTVGGLEFYISSFIDPTELASTITSTVIGIGLESNLKSTVTGLGSAGYVSTLSLVSTTFGLEQYISSFIDPVELASSILPFISSSYFTTQLVSTVEGLGSASYVSSAQLLSTTFGLEQYISSFIDPTELASTITSTVFGLGLEPNLKSTVTGLGSSGYISSLSLVSTTQGLQASGFFNLQSTVEGLGSAGYVSTTFLDVAFSTFSTAMGPGVDPTVLGSTIEGLGTFGYVSSLSLVSTTFGLEQYISSFIDPTELASTVLSTVVGIGLQSNLTSTVRGLGSAGYVSTVSLVSTTFGLEQYISSFIDPVELASSILPFISSTYFTTSLTSTVDGLGSAGYVSTLSMYSAINTAISSLSTAYGIVGAGGLATIPSTVSTFSLLTSSLTASTIQTRTISSLDLWISSINGVVPGVFNGSTTSLSSASIFTSTLSSVQLFAGIGNFTSTLTSSLVVSGSELIKFNGTTSPSFYGHGIDTLTLQTSCNAYQSGVASMAFGVSNTGYPLARIYAIDSALAGSAIGQLVFQTTPFGAGIITSNYSYTGANQTFVVPAGVTSIQVLMWGAGGSGGAGQVGGAGAFVQGILPVTPGQTYTIVVGQGGVLNSLTTTYGGGGAGGNNINFSGSGGGRSAIQQTLTATISSASGSGSAITYTTSATHSLQTGQPVIITGLSPSGFNGTYAVASIPASNQFTVVSTQSGSSTGTGTIVAEIVNIGGGGAGPQANQGTGGMATFSGTANSGNVTYGGGGGSQTAGGAAGGGTSSPFPTAGQILLGGTGGAAGGAGGGGYYGGGGGGWTGGVGNGGGGGGSSYISNTLFGFQAGSNSPNSTNQAPATTATGYISGVAVGGNTLGNGGNGLIVINSYFGGGTITEAMRIGSNGYVGVATSSPTYALDVAAIGRISNAYIGTNSNLNALQFYGLSGNFNNTVLAEISTGGGTQELLVFKGSSASDRVRVQTTGNFVVETGVSARLWSTNTSRTTSNATPAFIINTSSNVGIQTASPGATLDVAGTGRFLTVSTQQVLASSIFTRNALASSITTSTLQTILTTTSSITASTIILRDQIPTCNAGNIYQRNSLLYFNNLFIFAGTRQAYGQVLQVGIGVGSGGNITFYTSGLNTYQVNTFTTSGTYSVSGGSLYADIFVLGGGGGGGGSYGGGGGGGGFIYAPNVFLTAGSYTVTIGQGGTGSLTNGTNGSNSVFTNGALITYTGFGGGTGGSYAGSFLGSNGGCGGGGAGNPSSAGGSASQGYAGGTGGLGAGGAGGGGMGQVGTSSGGGANGGNGSTITITGTAIVYGGGGAGGNTGITTFGGTGGGGNGAINRTAGTNGLGGGGGGGGFTGSTPLPGLNGGSGIVILRSPPG